ncbi:MAG: SCO family protein [Akkermansiaceae bacterium]
MKIILLCMTVCLFAACEKQTKTTGSTEKNPANKTESVTTVTAEEEKKACCSEHPSPAAVEATEDSIYQIESVWKDDAGSDRKLKSLGGRVQVISMGYSTCKYACPRLLADMRLIEKGLSPDARKSTGFTFVSIDPEADTPERLAEYRKENKIDSDRWTLLTAPTPSVQELAVVLGIQYRKTGDKDFAHSNIITVLNKNGEVIHRQEGLAADPAETIKAITAAQ